MVRISVLCTYDFISGQLLLTCSFLLLLVKMMNMSPSCTVFDRTKTKFLCAKMSLTVPDNTGFQLASNTPRREESRPHWRGFPTTMWMGYCVIVSLVKLCRWGVKWNLWFYCFYDQININILFLYVCHCVHVPSFIPQHDHLYHLYMLI